MVYRQSQKGKQRCTGSGRLHKAHRLARDRKGKQDIDLPPRHAGMAKGQPETGLGQQRQQPESVEALLCDIPAGNIVSPDQREERKRQTSNCLQQGVIQAGSGIEMVQHHRCESDQFQDVALAGIQRRKIPADGISNSHAASPS